MSIMQKDNSKCSVKEKDILLKIMYLADLKVIFFFFFSVVHLMCFSAVPVQKFDCRMFKKFTMSFFICVYSKIKLKLLD